VNYSSESEQRTPLERFCVHNMSPFISNSGLSSGNREAEVQRAKIAAARARW